VAALAGGRLGQRAATAFVATPARRADCAARLPPDRLGFYLACTGLYAMLAGDLATADEQLPAAISHIRDTGDRTNLPTSLQNLAECLGHLGQGGPAQAAAAEALTCAQSTGDRQKIRALHAYLGWLADLVGDTTAAEQHFTTADQICLTDDPDDDHLYSHGGDLVGRLAGPHGPSQPGPEAHPPQCPDLPPERLDDHVARCDRVLGRLALAAGDTAAAGTHLTAAAGCFRDGDYLTELAATLPSLADWAKATGDLDTAEQYATEAITIAAPRGLMPAHCAALAARARIRAAQAAAAGADPDLLFQGRDAANAALRLAARHHLPWNELDALRAHAALDNAEGVDQGWTAKADALYARLVPPDLDPDPLARVERLVAEQKAADADQEGSEDG